MEDHAFFTVRPLEWQAPRFHAVDRHEFPFCDVLASCDAVLTKPGFGIVSECVVNRKPVVYAERPEWPETAPLVEGIHRYGRGASLTLDRLYAGDVRGALDAAVAAPPPPEIAPAGGAEIAARRIRSFLPGRISGLVQG
jgi:UDP:flavonoid glycosyltransferase YjiC (YdhE family)